MPPKITSSVCKDRKGCKGALVEEAYMWVDQQVCKALFSGKRQGVRQQSSCFQEVETQLFSL